MLTEDHFQLRRQESIIIARVDMTTMSSDVARELVEALRARYRCDGVTRFALDLSQVEFLDSACIGILVGLLNDLAHLHGTIALIGCRSNVAFLFEVTRLDRVFMMYQDLETALTDLAGE